MLLGWRPSPRWREEEGRGKGDRSWVLVLGPGPCPRHKEDGEGGTNQSYHSSSLATSTYTPANHPLGSLHTPLLTDIFSSSPSVLFLPPLLALLPILAPSVCLLLHLHSDCVRLPSSALGCSSTAGTRPQLRFTRQTDCISFHRAV